MKHKETHLHHLLHYHCTKSDARKQYTHQRQEGYQRQRLLRDQLIKPKKKRRNKKHTPNTSTALTSLLLTSWSYTSPAPPPPHSIQTDHQKQPAASSDSPPAAGSYVPPALLSRSAARPSHCAGPMDPPRAQRGCLHATTRAFARGALTATRRRGPGWCCSGHTTRAAGHETGVVAEARRSRACWGGERGRGGAGWIGLGGG
jgi:hypothetical protein